MNDAALPSPAWQIVACLEDIGDPGACEFELPGEWPRAGFVVRRGASIFAYANLCPHAGYPLNWKPGAFFTRDMSLLLCSAHGALFEIETGLCVAGPCPGKRLRALECRVQGGLVEVRSATGGPRRLAEDPA